MIIKDYTLKTLLIFCFSTILLSNGYAQRNTDQKSWVIRADNFFKSEETLNRKKRQYALGLAACTYAGFSYALYNAWYANYDQEAFHLFNDWKEWRHMDKLGHFYSTYIITSYWHQGAKWWGSAPKEAFWVSTISSLLFQGTIELMDGFSSKWGFSIPDMAFNILGTSFFSVQMYIWKEQKIRLKVSNIPMVYDNNPIVSESGKSVTSLKRRTDHLFGTSLPEKFLKDYNSQVIWMSFNLRSFMKNCSVPKWLNLAVGYSGGNMFGGYENKWEEGDEIFSVSHERYSAFYISPDIDWNQIRTKYSSINTLFRALNVFKFPSPTLEFNTLGEFHIHLIK